MQPPNDQDQDQLPAYFSAPAWIKSPLLGGGAGPLVSVEQVKGHLAILRAVAQMKGEVMRGEGWGRDEGEKEGKGEKGETGEKDKEEKEEKETAEREGEKAEKDKEGVKEKGEKGKEGVKEGEKRWGWFVSMAVERFAKWLAGLRTGDEKLEMEVWLPPLDVFMVCHTYMLNPKWFGDDAERIPQCKVLYQMMSRTMDLARIEPLLRPTPPSQERLDFWNSRMEGGEWGVWDCHQLSPKTCLTMTISCPGCKSPLVVDLMTPDGTGYFQANFTWRCPEKAPLLSRAPDVESNPGYQLDICPLEGKAFTKETLAARKLAEDFAAFEQSGRAEVIPSLAFDTTEKRKEIAKMMKDRIIEVTSFRASVGSRRPLSEERGDGDKERGDVRRERDKGKTQRTLADDILQHFSEFGLGKFRPQGCLTSQRSAYLLNRILLAYNDDKPFSVELVGAVMRQGSFIDKMHALNWTKEGYFDDPQDERVLHHAIARYHAFLDLLSVYPTQFYVPTLDIDLVWHTHQLIPAQYQNDTTNYVGRFIDHDDKVEGTLLSTSFDETCRAWKGRFWSDYTACGFHPPASLPYDWTGKCGSTGSRGSNSIGRQLSKLINIMKLRLSRSSSSEGPLYDSPRVKGGGEGALFNTLKTLGRSAMLRPPHPPTPPSTSLNDDSETPSAEKTDSKRPDSEKGSETKEYPKTAQHLNVLAGSHPSDHDAVHYTGRTNSYMEMRVLGIYEQRGKERMGIWESSKVSKAPKLNLASEPDDKEQKRKDIEGDGDSSHDQPSLEYHGYRNGVPPWGVFLFPVPIIFGNEVGGENDANQDHLCVSVDAGQVRMSGGCASCGPSGCAGTGTYHESITPNDSYISGVAANAGCGGWSSTCGAAKPSYTHGGGSGWCAGGEGSAGCGGGDGGGGCGGGCGGGGCMG